MPDPSFLDELAAFHNERAAPPGELGTLDCYEHMPFGLAHEHTPSGPAHELVLQPAIGPESLADLTARLRASAAACKDLSRERRSLCALLERTRTDDAALLTYLKAPSQETAAQLTFLDMGARVRVNEHLEGIAAIETDVAECVIVERQRVRTRTDGLLEALDDVDAKLADVNTAIAAANLATIQDPGRGICPICMENEVEIANVPCGHLFCQLCLLGRPGGDVKCSMCRQTVQTSMRVYFGV
jgi:hypothetical protein